MLSVASETLSRTGASSGCTTRSWHAPARPTTATRPRRGLSSGTHAANFRVAPCSAVHAHRSRSQRDRQSPSWEFRRRRWWPCPGRRPACGLALVGLALLGPATWASVARSAERATAPVTCAPAAAGDRQTFTYRGPTVQTFTVPRGIATVVAEVYGGHGGKGAHTGDRRAGAMVVGYLQVVPGECLDLYVAGHGTPSGGGWGWGNGGSHGTAAGGDLNNGNSGAGGGGSSAIAVDHGPMIVAGGGGGGGGDGDRPYSGGAGGGGGGGRRSDARRGRGRPERIGRRGRRGDSSAAYKPTEGYFYPNDRACPAQEHPPTCNGEIKLSWFVAPVKIWPLGANGTQHAAPRRSRRLSHGTVTFDHDGRQYCQGRCRPPPRPAQPADLSPCASRSSADRELGGRSWRIFR
jgi:hypothetical protein